jgi:8-oxo-dGTP pyrophosphatase MutT (NUDIX family)
MSKFNSTPNQCIVHEGKEYWISRSCAINAIFIALHNEEPYILLNKRGPGTPDFQGYWNIPCGYIDWDEDGEGATMREIWEETGVDTEILLNNYEIVYNGLNPTQPWYVETSPQANRQNISLRYCLVFKVKEHFPTFSLESMEPDEVSEVKWVPVTEAVNYQLGFNHRDVILEFKKQVLKGAIDNRQQLMELLDQQQFLNQFLDKHFHFIVENFARLELNNHTAPIIKEQIKEFLKVSEALGRDFWDILYMSIDRFKVQKLKDLYYG